MSKRSENEAIKLVSLKDRESFLDEKNFKKNISDYVDDEELRVALSSQGGWSKYVRGNFLSMSLNTYKSVADKYLVGGFDGIDQKRVNALELIAQHLKKKDRINREVRADTKDGLNRRVKIKDRQISILRESNLLLSKGIEVIVDALDKLAKDSKDQNLKDVLEHEMSKVRALLSRSYMLKGVEMNSISEQDE
tara:strand:- start:3026 stop:3604 length:579 start_codon:yes stop_codon:yes gene_type:complete